MSWLSVFIQSFPDGLNGSAHVPNLCRIFHLEALLMLSLCVHTSLQSVIKAV